MDRGTQIVRDTLGGIVFAGFVGWAVTNRKSPQVHKRLMAYASMVLLGAALARLLAMTMPALPPPLTMWLIYIPLIGAIVLHDRRSLGHVHSATIRGGLIFTAATVAVTIGIPLLAG